MMTFKENIGSNCNSWKGGISEIEGYKRVWVGKYEYMLEHRYIMEKYLGRKLEKNELIHHINGNKLDNRIENLELINRSNHMKTHIEKITNAQLEHRKFYPDKFTGNTGHYKISKRYNICRKTVYRILGEYKNVYGI
jgi:hypothetical protein